MIACASEVVESVVEVEPVNEEKHAGHKMKNPASRKKLGPAAYAYWDNAIA
jgi:hypothetical protein